MAGYCFKLLQRLPELCQLEYVLLVKSCSLRKNAAVLVFFDNKDALNQGNLHSAKKTKQKLDMS